MQIDDIYTERRVSLGYRPRTLLLYLPSLRAVGLAVLLEVLFSLLPCSKVSMEIVGGVGKGAQYVVLASERELCHHRSESSVGSDAENVFRRFVAKTQLKQQRMFNQASRH